MPVSQLNDLLLAWIRPQYDQQCYKAAFVSAATPNRIPATQYCVSHQEAKRWVEREAAALRVPVHWTDDPPANVGSAPLWDDLRDQGTDKPS